MASLEFELLPAQKLSSMTGAPVETSYRYTVVGLRPMSKPRTMFGSIGLVNRKGQ